MKRLRFFSLLPALLALLWGNCALAADSQTPPAAPAALIGQQGVVLGQSATAPPAAAQLPAQPSQGQSQGQNQATPPANAEAKKQPDAQTLFQESLRQMMPLNEGQIQEYRERSDQRERALLPIAPTLSSRTVRVSLEQVAWPTGCIPSVCPYALPILKCLSSPAPSYNAGVPVARRC